MDKVPRVTGSSDSFEIHVSQEGRWSLAEVAYVRDHAIARAQQIGAEPGVGAARVVWSRFDPSADVFTERTIFNTSRQSGAAVLSEPHMPPGPVNVLFSEPDDGLGCRVGADLYRPEARMAIHHVLASELDNRRITTLELLHDWEHARAVTDVANLVQAATQRHVIETGRPGVPSVTHRIKRLYAVIDEASLALHRIAHSPERPTLLGGGLGQLVEAWIDRPEGERVVFSALAEFLRPAEGWGEKMVRLAEALPSNPRPIELRFIDEIATEVVATKRGFSAIIGARQRSIDAVLAAIAVVDGVEDDGTLTPEAAILTRAAGGMARLPLLRIALARRARRIVEANLPLGEDSVQDEVRNIAAIWRAVGGTAADGPLRRLLPALERRALRQMSPERLGMLLARTAEPWRRVDRLLELERDVIGAEAKGELGKYLHTVLADRAAPAGLEDRADNPGEVLRRLRRWQHALRDIGLKPQLREDLMRLVDRHAVRVISERKLFEAVARRHPVAWEQALALMDLVLADTFTQGEALRLAQDRMLHCLKNNGGLQALQNAMREDEQIAARGRVMYDFLAANRVAAAQ